MRGYECFFHRRFGDGETITRKGWEPDWGLFTVVSDGRPIWVNPTGSDLMEQEVRVVVAES
ncbi:hypothetical protein BGE01nite_00580 [Brevifollis gellanilyticus]|uniref:Uncharacterized protein n=1 Tax=Brevifollis gellanilyticus TaxID=748831 RepID=A0A512M1Z4_9BACT|nr:hypothetical protein BGE01nite_00580 [Brevifollis gellanilyticus]